VEPHTSDHIVVRGLRKTFSTPIGDIHALTDIHLQVRRGEILTLLGPSGCGKSTLLAIMGGMLPADQGEVLIDGEVCTGPDPKKVAMVFQDPGLFPWRTALENVEFGLEIQGAPKTRRNEVARKLLEPLGLKGFEHRYPRQLSGGMKQRVAIARALALDSEILLMDEPFAALDEQTRLHMADWLLKVWAGARKTIVFVTHSIQEAIAISHRIAVMTARPGRIKGIFDDPLPHPRDLTSREANDLRAVLWDQVREESLKAMESAG
jgi:NitT/TauT family transport system ATP-binding protein